MEPEELLRQSEDLVRRQVEAEGPNHRIGQLQPGEDPTSQDPEDAKHWGAVYRELVEFKGQLVDEIEERIERSAHPPVGKELAHDRNLLTMELQRLKIHLAFWEERTSPAS